MMSHFFEAAESIIRGIGLRKSRLGRTVVAGLNSIGQVGLAVYFTLKRRPVMVQGQRMDCRARERSSFRSTLEILLDRYEPETTKLFHRLLRPGMTVVDLGAHGGYFSLIGARCVGATGKVYAFEPYHPSFEELLRNIGLNRYENIFALRKAVADRTGASKLILSPKGSDRHSLYSRGETDESIMAEVETTSLDDFLRELNWPRIDLIKMDIEGAEPAALAGMRQALERCKISFIITEFSPPLLMAAGFDPQSFLQELSNTGFSLFVIEEVNEPKPLSPGEFSGLIHDLQNKGGTNLLCENRRSRLCSLLSQDGRRGGVSESEDRRHSRVPGGPS
jgi:FkbM family methyltransferase